MSARALEFVETWVSEKIEEKGYPKEGEDPPAKHGRLNASTAARDEGIPALEISDAFDDLPSNSSRGRLGGGQRAR